MSAEYGDLFTELYTQKYIDSPEPQNALQRLQVLQYKIRTCKTFRKRFPEQPHSNIEHLPNLE